MFQGNLIAQDHSVIYFFLFYSYKVIKFKEYFITDTTMRGICEFS